SKPAITSALIFRKQDGKNSGCIVFTNIRPVILSADNAITTDIAGIIVQQLEKKLECPVIFHTMPACDVSLKIETADLASTKRVGTRIAQQLLSEIKRARYSKLEKAYAYSLKTDMPMKAECKLPVSTLSEKAERYSEQIKELKNIDLDIPDKGELLNRTIRYASFALRNDSAGNNEIPLIMGLRLDTMSIFYLPGATTISTADSLTRLMPQTILLASGLNGMHDAILPDEAFDEGGWWASVSSYTKGAEKELLKSMNSLVASTFPRIFKKRLLKAE
ncbi:MAG: hypothetical protein JNL74_18255, partial [Fibrobacteres bacterium]|nr:hypothetical protein [Fibrobacterota bacterium]